MGNSVIILLLFAMKIRKLFLPAVGGWLGASSSVRPSRCVGLAQFSPSVLWAAVSTNLDGIQFPRPTSPQG